MNKGFLLGIVMVLCASTNVLAAEKSPWETKLPFKHATIHYTISGMENGNEVLYIRDYGREVARYHTTKTSMMGMTMENKTVDISTPDWEYSFDLTNHEGTKNVNPEKYMIAEYNKLSKAERKEVNKNAEEMGVSVAEGFGGQVQKNAIKIHGYSCDRAEMMGTVTYSIHGTDIPLLLESNMMGMKMKIEATSVDKGKIADKYFQHPAGIEAVLDPQSDAIAQSMAKETIAMLKDPEGVKKLQDESMEERMGEQGQLTPEQQEQAAQAMQMLQGLFGGQKQQ